MRHPYIIPAPGSRFGRLVVGAPIGRSASGMLMIDVVCDCGKPFSTTLKNLFSGQTKSCGCLKFDIHSRRLWKHGMVPKALYTCWRNMLMRCSNPGYEGYENYGGRGISVCDEWKVFIAFRDWAFSSGYAKGLTIERKDVNGSYNADNCCWIPKSAQAWNKRNSHLLTAFGETKSVPAWARDSRCRVSQSVIRGRIYRWESHEAILTTPKLH